jgi:hypothetical protein
MFRADKLSEGPIYKLQSPVGGTLNLGFSLHTTWLSPEEMDRMKCTEDVRKKEREAVWENFQERAQTPKLVPGGRCTLIA